MKKIIKRLLSGFLAAAVMASTAVTASALDVTTDDVYVTQWGTSYPRWGDLRFSDNTYASLYGDNGEGYTATPANTDITEAVIPDTVNGKRVSKVDSFKNCTKLTSVTIPESVVVINYYAFENCTALKNVTMLDGVDTIYDYAFRGCSNLVSVDLSDKLIDLGREAFKDCTSLESVTIPESVWWVYEKAFYGCTSLKSVTFSEGTTWLAKYAFAGCTSLTDINIPDSLGYISTGVFKDCTSLKNIDLHEGMAAVGISGFEGCTGLETITLPHSIQYLGLDAFKGCTTDIYYAGTEEEWKKIGVTDYTDNMTLTLGDEGAYELVGLQNVTVHFDPSAYKETLPDNYVHSVKVDVNEDGYLNIMDVISMLELITKTEKPIEYDLSYDNNVNILDVIALLEILATPHNGKSEKHFWEINYTTTEPKWCDGYHAIQYFGFDYDAAWEQFGTNVDVYQIFIDNMEYLGIDARTGYSTYPVKVWGTETTRIDKCTICGATNGRVPTITPLGDWQFKDDYNPCETLDGCNFDTIFWDPYRVPQVFIDNVTLFWELIYEM